MIFMSPAREAHIHLYQVEHQFGSDKKVNSEIHIQHTKKQVIDSPDLFFFAVGQYPSFNMAIGGPFPSWEGAQ